MIKSGMLTNEQIAGIQEVSLDEVRKIELKVGKN